MIFFFWFIFFCAQFGSSSGTIGLRSNSKSYIRPSEKSSINIANYYIVPNNFNKDKCVKRYGIQRDNVCLLVYFLVSDEARANKKLQLLYLTTPCE